MSAVIDFQAYQQFVPTTALYPDAGTGSALEVIYLGLGMMGEVQEWEETPEDDREVGDILWYIASMCNACNLGMCWLWFCNHRVPDVRPNLAEALKKHLRDDKEILAVIESYIMWTFDRIINARINAGDTDFEVQEYLPRAMAANQAKLLARQEKGTLQGDGNDR